ncbi:ferritin-like protein [Pontibacter ummariensis]|uniref:Ferritin-like n=1 Tax=Pontibacter ummariensis TaxID=1610492 RepID=A0A239FW24_9BACT|nr:ferritin-like protein [Pontibacter ummariensis]PRY11892.1 ferritin-like protein [Pontibacter ummariensis]SNS61207.1 Ferritin-like [Pontibacter ummariensis]
MINTREELLNALAEAAELEHGLLIQYLFAAFSLKRRPDEGISLTQQLMIEDWEKTILSVAHQEMYHLANVCNLLSAIGGAPRFERPNFPQPLKKYYPFDFQLEKFNDFTLYRFIIFELPQGVTPPPPPKEVNLNESIKTTAAFAPDPLIYNHIGELYNRIAEGFKAIPESLLFIGSHNHQDIDRWTLRLSMHAVTNRETALKAIKEIVEEGEGTTNNRKDSHYDKFLKIREALLAEKAKDPDFEPARQIVINPQTREHRDINGAITLITNKISRKVAELFNTTYSTMLMMLIQYYSYGDENQHQREMLRDSSRRLMSALIRPLAEILTEMPVSESVEDGMSGPGFEIYGPLGLLGKTSSRWKILLERIQHHIEDVDDILQFRNEHPVLNRMGKLRENLAGTMINLKSITA